MFGFCECLEGFGVRGGWWWGFLGAEGVEGNVRMNRRYLLLVLKKDSDDILIFLNQKAEYFFED